jgi:putative flippase GtrA
VIARTSLVYGLVAGLCLGLHNLIIIVNDRAGQPLIAGVVVSFVLVAAMGYALHSRFTFRRPMGWVGFGRYALAMSANLPLAFGSIWLWRHGAGLPMIYASPLASVSMIAVNFALSHWAIARPQRRA